MSEGFKQASKLKTLSTFAEAPVCCVLTIFCKTIRLLSSMVVNDLNLLVFINILGTHYALEKGSLVWRQGMRFDPTAAGIGVEILAGVNTGIHGCHDFLGQRRQIACIWI